MHFYIGEVPYDVELQAHMHSLMGWTFELIDRSVESGKGTSGEAPYEVELVYGQSPN